MTRINVEYVFPPVPFRDCDWQATFDDYDGAPDSHCPIGRGPTRDRAVSDLIEQAVDAGVCTQDEANAMAVDEVVT